MAPFTTYSIPEPPIRKTPSDMKWLWIIVDQPLLPIQEELLQKISEALKADFIKDVFVYQCSKDDSINLSDLKIYKPVLVISFGVTPSSLGLWIDQIQPGIRLLEAYSFISTIRLDELINQPAAKKILWSSMQSFLQNQATPQ